MTKIVDDAEAFASSALAGFAGIYGRYVRLVKGGVVRSTKVPQGKVSVVVGGDGVVAQKGAEGGHGGFRAVVGIEIAGEDDPCVCREVGLHQTF